MSFTDLKFGVENDEKESQCLINRVPVDWKPGVATGIHLSDMPT
jgi:hypothetical protein